jgi:hypothetical protein
VYVIRRFCERERDAKYGTEMTRPRRRVEVIHTGLTHGCFTLPGVATAPHAPPTRNDIHARNGPAQCLGNVPIGRVVTSAIARRPTLRPAPKVYGSLVLGLRPTRTMRRRVGALWSCLSPRPSFNVLGSGIRIFLRSLLGLIALHDGFVGLVSPTVVSFLNMACLLCNLQAARYLSSIQG